jgi:protease IV
MTFETFMLVKKMKRWRWWAIIASLIAVALSFVAFKPKNNVQTPYIARIEIGGIIQTNEKLIALVQNLKKDVNVKGVLAVIDSPGGTTAGAEALYDAMRELALTKPLVTQIETVGASGGYIAAIAGDYIVTRKTSIVGSIGVLVQYPNVTKLMDTVGVKYETIKSSPLKASPNPFETASPEAQKALAEMINGSFVWFKDLVKERRGYSDEQVKQVADGRVFTGTQALALKLIDATGGDNEINAYFKTKAVGDLPMRKREPEKPKKSFMQQILTESLGLEPLITKINRESLDGMLVLWQPHF